jgi:hypothetical protein
MEAAVACNDVGMSTASPARTKTVTGRFLAGFLDEVPFLAGTALTGESMWSFVLRVDASSSESEDSEELLDRSESRPSRAAASVLGEGLTPPLGAALGGESSLDSSVVVRDTVTGRPGDIGCFMSIRPGPGIDIGCMDIGGMDIGGTGPPIRMAIII